MQGETLIKCKKRRAVTEECGAGRGLNVEYILQISKGLSSAMAASALDELVMLLHRFLNPKRHVRARNEPSSVLGGAAAKCAAVGF
jgi:hypothetical protein